MSTYNFDQYNDTFAFIHIPKTGGTSVKHSLKIRAEPHRTYKALKSEYKAEGKQKVFSNLRFYTIVRDPVDRFVSGYNYFIDKGHIVPEEVSPNDLINYICRSNYKPFGRWSLDCVFFPQVRFLKGDDGLLSKNIAIGKYEGFRSFFSEMQKEIYGNSLYSLSHRIKSTKHVGWKDISNRGFNMLRVIYYVDFYKWYPQYLNDRQLIRTLKEKIFAE